MMLVSSHQMTLHAECGRILEAEMAAVGIIGALPPGLCAECRGNLEAHRKEWGSTYFKVSPVEPAGPAGFIIGAALIAAFVLGVAFALIVLQ